MIKVVDTWFERKRVDDDVTMFTEPYVHAFVRCNIWHVRGRDRDLLIDTGMGIASLREAANDLLQKSLTAVATHSHFDHVGGLHEFRDCCAIHQLEVDALAAAEDGMALTTEQLGTETVQLMRDAGYELAEGPLLDAVPYAGFELEAHSLEPVKAVQVLREGDALDLGNRHFEVLHLPGHSPGSIGLYERSTETLFSGDAVYDGPLLGNLPDSDLASYVKTLRRLLELPVKVVHGGHDPSFDGARLREIALAYLRRWDT
jgi:glyoxylase-like metal-dependent hydrolase (beta-lactamase superfamily II)